MTSTAEQPQSFHDAAAASSTAKAAVDQLSASALADYLQKEFERRSGPITLGPRTVQRIVGFLRQAAAMGRPPASGVRGVWKRKNHKGEPLYQAIGARGKKGDTVEYLYSGPDLTAAVAARKEWEAKNAVSL